MLAYAVAFTLGLLSAFHCIGMCGGIVGALSFGVTAEARARPGRLALFVFAFNGGRILSYVLAGALLAWAGGWLIDASWARIAVQVIAALMIILIGLHVGNWFPRLTLIERLGLPLWRRLEPVAHRLHPVRRPGRALLYGMIWGWVPCGLVYSVLISSLALHSVAASALYMLAFGLGTLPVMMATGLLAGRIQALTRDPGIRGAIALAVVLMGCIALWYALGTNL